MHIDRSVFWDVRSFLKMTSGGWMMANRAFVRTIGIDYSGEATPKTRLGGLAVYRADGNAPPQEVTLEGPSSKRWTRKEIAEWLVDQLREEGDPTLVGIDHAFSFPICYFERYNLRQQDWDYFLHVDAVRP